MHEENLEKVLKMGKRENCPVSPVGVVTNDGTILNTHIYFKIFIVF